MSNERVSLFLKGELNWAQLVGISVDEAYAMAEIGFNLLTQGRLEDAEKIFLGLVSMNPTDGYFHCVLGSIFGRQGRLEEAHKELQACVELGYVDSQVFVNRAEIALKQGQLYEALADLERVIESEPTNSPPAMRAQAMLQTVMQSIQLARAQKDA